MHTHTRTHTHAHKHTPVLHFQPRNKDGQRPEIVLDPQAVDSDRQKDEGVMFDRLQFSAITMLPLPPNYGT